MPANFLTLPAHSISTDIEKHDGMPANCLERFLFVFVGISFPGASRAAVEDQMGSQVDLLMLFRTPLRK
jgi:hypothetical protein